MGTAPEPLDPQGLLHCLSHQSWQGLQPRPLWGLAPHIPQPALVAV